MARERFTKMHNIFCLDKGKIVTSLFSGKPATNDEIIDRLLVENKEYKIQALKVGTDTLGFDLHLFFFGEIKKNSRLSTFCKPFVDAKADVITFRPQMASSILFVCSENNIFAITTGQGFRVIEKFCISKFGMIFLSRYFDSIRISAMDSNGMATIIHSNRVIYSNEINFVDIDNLDTIFKEITGRVYDKEIVQSLLALDNKSKRRTLKVIARNYVQIGSSLDIEKLLKLLTIIDGFDFNDMSDRFNLILPLDSKKDSSRIALISETIEKSLYKNICDGKYLGFDLFHEDTMSFINADIYQIKNGNNALSESEDLKQENFVSDAYQKFLNGEDNNFANFHRFLEQGQLVATKDDVAVTDGGLLEHLSGEIVVENKNYYVFYGKYYLLDKSYAKRLDESLSQKLKLTIFESIIKTKWADTYDEGIFNGKASNDEGFIHLHLTKPENIEFADLLKIENNVATIVHVKDDFNCTMRELERQVELSITRLLDLKNNNNDLYIRKLYRNACENRAGINISSIFDDEDKFVDALKKSDFRYVIVIHPNSANKDLLASESNIAKHCLNSLILKCSNRNVDLKINIA